MRTIFAALAFSASLAAASWVPMAHAVAGQTIADRVAAAQAAADAEAAANPPRPDAAQQAVPALVNQLVIPVPAINIYVGDTITDAMLVDRVFAAPPNTRIAVATSRQALVGKVARRSMPAGEPVAINAFSDATLVTRGVLAPVLLKEGGLTISGFGMPLENGSVGMLVRLKNMDSGQVFAGTVQADGSIRVSAQ